MSFIIDPDKNNGTPYISDIHLELSQDTTRIVEPYPEGFFHINANVNGGLPYLTETSLKLSEDTSVVKAPYPQSFFRKSMFANNDVPYISDEHLELAKNDTAIIEPYPTSFFKKTITINDNTPYISEKDLELAEDNSYVVTPYPQSFFKLDKTNNVDPVNDHLPYISEESMELSKDTKFVSAPYPQSFFRKELSYNNDTPYISKEELINGAFIHAIEVEYVFIPYRTLNFGKYAFMDTPKLSELEINILSDYNEETTFSDNTLIKYYNVQYYNSKDIADLTDNDDVVTFSDLATISLGEEIQVYTGGRPIHRARKPENEIGYEKEMI